MNYCLVVDTNALWGELHLFGLKWEALAAGATDESVFLRFPATVLDELESKACERAKNGSKALREIKSFMREPSQVQALSDRLDRELVDEYRSDLELRIMALGAEILPYPAVEHEVVAARALRREPPFNLDGGGYRDTLIWLSALDEAEELELPLVFVSNDKAFRATGKAVKLDPRLKDEAAARGVEAYLELTVADAVSNYLTDGDTDRYVTEAALGRAQTFIDDNLYDAAVRYERLLEPRLLALPRSTRDVSSNWVEDACIQKFGRVREVAPGEVVYTFSLSCTVELEFTVDEFDAEVYGFDLRSYLGLGEVTATMSKGLITEGFITFSEGEPLSIELDSWAALDSDDGHAAWDDPCGCFGLRHDRGGASNQ